MTDTTDNQPHIYPWSSLSQVTPLDKTLVIDPVVKLEDGSVWVHEDYQMAVEPWAVEAHKENHLKPISGRAAFGDIESWAAYVKRYVTVDSTSYLITTDNAGFGAILDYHDESGVPGPCQWQAEYKYVWHESWVRWMRAVQTNGGITQQQLVELIDDQADDIKDPDQASLLALISKLRVTVNRQAQSELNADGTTKVSYSQDEQLRGDSTHATIPQKITLSLPIVKGDKDVITNESGEDVLAPVVWKVEVRIRVSVQNDCSLRFRLSIPKLDATLEKMRERMVMRAQEELGASYLILRAAD